MILAFWFVASLVVWIYTVVTGEFCVSIFRVEVSSMLPGRFTRISKEHMKMMNQKNSGEEKTWPCPGLGQEIIKTALLRTTVDRRAGQWPC
jgi:hypothetical protein